MNGGLNGWESLCTRYFNGAYVTMNVSINILKHCFFDIWFGYWLLLLLEQKLVA